MTLTLGRRITRLTASITLLAAAGVCAANAQTPQPPYALFQYGTLTGSGNTMTATQVPVVIAGGITVYVNLTMQFNADSNGNLTIASGFPQIVPAPALLVGQFKAGNYAGPSTVNSGSNLIAVNGPGVTDGGATEWSLTTRTGANGCTYPSSGTWYVGPLTSSPLKARITTAGISSTAYSYGVLGSGPTCFPGTAWYANTLVGVSQIGNTLTIVSFTNNGVDKAVPVDQITYTLQP